MTTRTRSTRFAHNNPITAIRRWLKDGVVAVVVVSTVFFDSQGGIVLAEENHGGPTRRAKGVCIDGGCAESLIEYMNICSSLLALPCCCAQLIYINFASELPCALLCGWQLSYVSSYLFFTEQTSERTTTNSVLARRNDKHASTLYARRCARQPHGNESPVSDTRITYRHRAREP